MLAFCEGRRRRGGDRVPTDLLVRRSTDGGRTWTVPREITGAVTHDDWDYYGIGPGVGIQLERGPHAGRLLIPAIHWTHFWEGEVPADNFRDDDVF